MAHNRQSQNPEELHQLEAYITTSFFTIKLLGT